MPWNGLGGVAYAILSFFAAQIFAAVAVYIIAALRHPHSASASLKALESGIAGQFIYVFLAEAAIVGLILGFLKLKKARPALIGLRRLKGGDALYGLAAVPLYYVLYLAILALVKQLDPSLNVNQSQDVGFNNPVGVVQMALTFISLVILPPIAEEILVRGFLYSSLKKILPTAWAVIVTSGFFAAAHLPEGGSSGPLYIAAVDTFTLSLVLIFLREKTGGLWAGMLLHAIKNGIAFVALFALNLK